MSHMPNETELADLRSKLSTATANLVYADEKIKKLQDYIVKSNEIATLMLNAACTERDRLKNAILIHLKGHHRIPEEFKFISQYNRSAESSSPES